MTNSDILTVILATIAVLPGIYAVIVQFRKDALEAAAKREDLLAQKETDKANATLQDANASRVISDTMKNVIADLRAEMKNQDVQHMKDLEFLQARLLKDFQDKSEMMGKEHSQKLLFLGQQVTLLSSRLEDAMAGIKELQAQIKELGHEPVYPRKKKISTH